MDFETRSRAKLSGPSSVGAYRYSEDESTKVLCCAFKPHGEKPLIWVPDWVRDRLDFDTDLPLINAVDRDELIRSATQIEAHNAMFERAVWKNRCIPFLGWPEFPRLKMRCSMAKALMHSLPGSLDDALKALGLGVGKDQEGYKLMLRMCKPKKPSKKDPREWIDDGPSLERLAKYCLQDVVAEEALSDALIDLPPYEQKLWHLDQEINERGIPVDRENVGLVIAAIRKWENEMLKEIEYLTGWTVTSVKQRDKSLAWLKRQGVNTPDLQKATVTQLLKTDLPPKVRRFFEIRQSLAKSSVAKYDAFLRCACRDGRVRGTQNYHRAGTGRWAGALVQPQNMPRGTYKDVEFCIQLLRDEGFEGVEEYFGDPMTAMANCIRAMIVAGDGNEFTTSDYSAIEARVNAAIAGEIVVLRTIEAGLGLYETAASGIFGVPYDTVNSDQRQVGKVSELALGYQGGIGAYASMARNYSVDLEALPGFVLPGAPDWVKERAYKQAETYLTNNPEAEMSLDAAAACDVIKQLWRKQRPHIVSLWKELEEAASEAALSPGKVVRCRGGVAFKCQQDLRFLLCKLPSGRRLFYYKPAVRVVTAPWGERKNAVTCWTVDGNTKQWVRRALYGGLLCENVVQATARDILVHGMFKVEEAGYRIIFTVHDEAVSENPVGFGSQEEFDSLLATIPAWAAGYPITAEGWRGKRYRK